MSRSGSTALSATSRRWPLYMIGALPAFWFLYLGLTGGLGVEPIKALEHGWAELALQLLIVGSGRHAAADICRDQPDPQFRRALGADWSSTM